MPKCEWCGREFSGTEYGRSLNINPFIKHCSVKCEREAAEGPHSSSFGNAGGQNDWAMVLAVVFALLLAGVRGIVSLCQFVGPKLGEAVKALADKLSSSHTALSSQGTPPPKMDDVPASDVRSHHHSAAGSGPELSEQPVPPPIVTAKAVRKDEAASERGSMDVVKNLPAKFKGLDAQKKLLVSIIGGTSLLMFLCCGSCGLLGMIGNLLDPNPQSSTTDSEEHENGSQAVTSQSNQVGSSDSATSLNDKVTLDEETALQLLDRPESFRGRTITCKVFYDGAGLRRGDRLFQMPVLIFAKGGNVTVKLDIPNDIDLPNIQPGQNLVVTWLCNNGSIEFGN